MLVVHSILLYLHIAVGVVALMIFWIPVVGKKGSLNHKRYGLAYMWCMYTIAISATLMSIMVLLAPTYFKADMLAGARYPEAALNMVYGAWTLLLVLSLLTFNSVHQGRIALVTKTDRSYARKPYNVLVPIALLVAAAVLLGMTIAGHLNAILGYVFSIGGMISALQSLRYAFAKRVAPNAWLLEHLGSMLGSGIGVYTAFFAFGGRYLLSHLGEWQLVLWILPGVLGGIAIHFWSRRYAIPASQRTSASIR